MPSAGSQQRDQDLEQQQVIPLRNLSNPDTADQHWIDVFNHYDYDNDGKISIHELHEIIRSASYRQGDIPDGVVQEIMAMSDTDNNGYLNLQEFVEMIHRPEHRHIFGSLFQRYVKLIVPPRRHYDATDERDSGIQDFEVIQAVDTATYQSQDYVYGPITRTDGQYEEQYKCWPPAICMIIVSVIEFILYLHDAIIDHPKGTGPIATVLIYNPYKRFEAWRYLSYMFVHIGSMHLVINLIVQLLLGIPLEMVHKWWRVLIVYLAGVVAGSLGTSITDPNVFLAGASGGVYALITAHLATIFMNWSEIEFAPIQLGIFLCIIVTDVGTAIYNRYHLQLDESIGYVAHLAGAIAGLLVGIGILRNLEVKGWEKKLWWCAVTLYFLLMTIAVFMNIFWKDHFPEPRIGYK